MFHHAQCTSLASSGSKKKLVRVTNQIYLISLMCWIKNRLIKSKNSMVDGAFDPFFQMIHKSYLSSLEKNFENLYIFTMEPVKICSRNIMTCKLYKKENLGPTIKKLTHFY